MTGAHILIPRAPDAEAFRRRDPDAAVIALGGETMGTRWSAQIVGGDGDAARAEIEAALALVIRQMSHWEPASTLSRINAGPPGRYALEPEFAEVMAAALAITEQSGGAFDPTIGALVDLWGFGPKGGRTDIPEDDALAEARVRSGVHHLDWEAGSRTLVRTAPVALDLSGIAKGYAVDLCANALRALGHQDFLIEIGGECVGAGIQPDGQPWWVDVEDADGRLSTPVRIALHDHAVATSGDYRRWFEASGKRFSHSIDPRDGQPIDNQVVQVTVLHEQAMIADGWASALHILGPDKGMALSGEHGLAAHIVMADGSAHLSPALIAMM